MNIKEFTIAGAVVYWTPSDLTDAHVLKAELQPLGLGHYAPAPRQPLAVLKDALESICRTTSNTTTLIRPLANDGFVVVIETKGADENSYTSSFSVKIGKMGGLDFHRNCAFDLQQSISAEYMRLASLLRPAQVTSALTSMLAAIQGISLRQNGAVYFLPESSFERWLAICNAAEVASARFSGSKFYMVRTIMDADTTKAVTDAITADVMEQAKATLEEVTAGTLKEKALTNRIESMRWLTKKIEAYEHILNNSLQHLTEASKKAEAAACAAILLVNAEQLGPLEVA